MRLASLLAAIAAVFVATEARAYTFIHRSGCPGDMGAAWPSRLLPSKWQLHEAGYPPLPLGEVVDTLVRSVQAWAEPWGEPCCSGFSQEFAGKAVVDGLGSPDLNVVSFEMKNWPSWLGHPSAVIAVTIPGIQRLDCEITDADMIFNGVGFDFRTDGDLEEGTRDTDLETIAVHEFGHWIGLDHSRNPEAERGWEPESVMFPTYRGGIGDRSLYLDDKLGACALYPTSCGPCTSDGDCSEGMHCNPKTGECLRVSCQSYQQCPVGSTCVDGKCWRGCSLNLDCGEGEVCVNGSCASPSTCTTCRTCRRDRDCGRSPEHRCLQLFEGEPRRCTKYCVTDDDCDGTSICWDTSQPGIRLCGAPSSSLCPIGYECTDSTRCGRLGDLCIQEDGCGGDSDHCVLSGGMPICSCSCRVDEDCGDGRCLKDPRTGIPSCYPRDQVERCGDTFCPDGSGCYEGVCRAICKGTLCAEGELCQDGQCLSSCKDCLPGEVCDKSTGICMPSEACVDVVCDRGEACVEGVCEKLCGSKPCGDPVKKATQKKRSDCSAAGAEVSILAFIAALFLVIKRKSDISS